MFAARTLRIFIFFGSMDVLLKDYPLIEFISLIPRFRVHAHPVKCIAVR